MNRVLKAALAAWLCAGASLAGCSTSVRETFKGQEPDQVWSAMVAAARTPDYSGGADYTQRWNVRENNIWLDEPNRRIEIFRRLERTLHRPGSSPHQEERQWKLQAVMEKVNPPEVRFTSRQMGVPSHAWDEAERYFDDVWNVLGGRPAEKPQPESRTAEQSDS